MTIDTDELRSDLADYGELPSNVAEKVLDEIDRLRALLTEARACMIFSEWDQASESDELALLDRIDAALDGGSGSVAHQEWESGVAWERHADALDGGVCATCDGMRIIRDDRCGEQFCPGCGGSGVSS